MKSSKDKSKLEASLAPRDDPFGFKKLKTMSLDDIYSDLYNQFSSRQSFTSLPVSMRIELDDGNFDIPITPGQETNESSLDTWFLSSYLTKGFGKLLVDFPHSKEISPWIKRLNLLYGKAREYEDDLYKRTKPLTESLEGLAKSLSVLPAISGIIKGAHEILTGYNDQTSVIDLDKETLNIYQISCGKKIDKIQELSESVDNLLRGMGQLIVLPNGKNYDNLLKIHIFEMLSHNLFEHDINFLGRDLEEGSEESKSVEIQSKKFYAAKEILWECVYGRKDEHYYKSSRLPSDTLKEDPIVVARYNLHKNYLIKQKGAYDSLREDLAYLLKIGVPFSAFGIPDEVEFEGSC